MFGLTNFGEEVALEAASTHLAEVDLSAAVDPGCRCLWVSHDPTMSLSLKLDVQLRDRNVWPSQARFTTPSGESLLIVHIPRVDPDTVGSWTSVTVRIPGRSNAWRTWNASRGGDASPGQGANPPWHNARVTIMRQAVLGVPALSAVPIVRSVALLTATSSLDEVQMSHILQPNMSFHLVDGSDALHAVGADGVVSVTPGVPVQHIQLGTMMGTLRAAMFDAACQGDCTPFYLMLRGGNLQFLSSVELEDAAGRVASVDVSSISSSGESSVPMSHPRVQEQTSFAWDNVVAVAFRLDDVADATMEETAPEVFVSHLRIGKPARAGHISDPARYNTDDHACDPLLGTFDAFPYARHDPVRYSHCRECCCFFDDPSNPSVKHCYEQGDVIADVTPYDAPNDQCAVCNRDANPQTMTPIRSLLLSEEVIPCDDGQPCMWNDKCTDEGACVGELYTSCLIKEFWGGDPSKDCEVRGPLLHFHCPSCSVSPSCPCSAAGHGWFTPLTCVLCVGVPRSVTVPDRTRTLAAASRVMITSCTWGCFRQLRLCCRRYSCIPHDAARIP